MQASEVEDLNKWHELRSQDEGSTEWNVNASSEENDNRIREQQKRTNTENHHEERKWNNQPN